MEEIRDIKVARKSTLRRVLFVIVCLIIWVFIRMFLIDNEEKWVLQHYEEHTRVFYEVKSYENLEVLHNVNPVTVLPDIQMIWENYSNLQSVYRMKIEYLDKEGQVRTIEQAIPVAYTDLVDKPMLQITLVKDYKNLRYIDKEINPGLYVPTNMDAEIRQQKSYSN